MNLGHYGSIVGKSMDTVKRKMNSALIRGRTYYMKSLSKKSDPAKSLAHVTAYSVGNVGDTALSECVRQTFRTESDFDSWKLISVYDPVNNAVIDQINSTKGVVIGGGGLFLPDSNENSLSGWQWAISEELLEKINVPIAVFTVGYNNFRGQSDSELFIQSLNALIRKASFVGLRNQGSVNHVKALLEPPLREKVIFQPCTTTIARKIYPDLLKKKNSRSVAFNIAFDRADRRYGENKNEILLQIADALLRIRDRGYTIKIVGHCAADLDFMKFVHMAVENDASNLRGIEIINASAWSCKHLLEFYNGVDCVLGMRGHAQMIPFGVNCRIITLGSHAKMKWFLEDIDAEDWYIEITEGVESLADRIFNKFININETNAERTTLQLMEKQNKLYEITKANMELINQVFKI